MKRAALLLSGLVMLGAACAGAAAPRDETPALTPTPAPRPGVLGGTDVTMHSVDLADVHFDTFDGGSIPPAQISESRLLALRDLIPPLTGPLYESAAEGAAWLEPEDLVLGYEAADGAAYAFPARILNAHEIVNDELGGEPVLVTYCPLCRSGVVYDRRQQDLVLTFAIPARSTSQTS